MWPGADSSPDVDPLLGHLIPLPIWRRRTRGRTDRRWDRLYLRLWADIPPNADPSLVFSIPLAIWLPRTSRGTDRRGRRVRLLTTTCGPPRPSRILDPAMHLSRVTDRKGRPVRLRTTRGDPRPSPRIARTATASKIFVVATFISGIVSTVTLIPRIGRTRGPETVPSS